ncbi:hypothetical protein [Actinokineospora bangkokensis]|uniref:hypothetical protein n=1 Tax=Actinokineospora bangkokensis TaxID=1193682 RepID=UPI0011779A82|nr:hypothetical protein [Actinokineospora bangkokensis]
MNDLAFLVSLIEDVEQVLTALGDPPKEGHLALADVLDKPGHVAWAAAGSAREDAQLLWEVLRAV